MCVWLHTRVHACNSSNRVCTCTSVANQSMQSEPPPPLFAQLLIAVSRLSELLILKDSLLFTFWKSKKDVLPLCGAARRASFLFTNYPRFAKKKSQLALSHSVGAH